MNLQMARRFFGPLRPPYSFTYGTGIILSTGKAVFPSDGYQSQKTPVFLFNFFFRMTVIGNVIQTVSKTDKPLFDKVRLVAASFPFLLAAVTAPSVLVTLFLRAIFANDPSTPIPPAERDDAPASSQDGSGGGKGGNGDIVVEKTDEDRVRRAVDEPATGFGPSPVNVREVLEDVLVIVVPGILLTFGQGVQYAQELGQSCEATPWVSTFSIFFFLFSFFFFV